MMGCLSYSRVGQVKGAVVGVSGGATSWRTAGNCAIDAVDRPVSHGQIPPT
jgi:hypothetical protein